MGQRNVTEEDRTHISRLRALRRSGSVNMFTELKRGLDMMLPPEEAEETWQWTKDNPEYYLSGEWTGVDA